MPETVSKMIMEMEAIIQKNFERVKKPLMSDEQMSLCDLGQMIDIVKDLSEGMKNLTKVKRYYAEHSDKKI